MLVSILPFITLEQAAHVWRSSRWPQEDAISRIVRLWPSSWSVAVIICTPDFAIILSKTKCCCFTKVLRLLDFSSWRCKMWCLLAASVLRHAQSWMWNWRDVSCAGSCFWHLGWAMVSLAKHFHWQSFASFLEALWMQTCMVQDSALQGKVLLPLSTVLLIFFSIFVRKFLQWVELSASENLRWKPLRVSDLHSSCEKNERNLSAKSGFLH